MYHKILVALENGPADVPLLLHVARLSKALGAELLLLHVADGFAAWNFEQLKLTESEEMRNDRHYLESTAHQLCAKGLIVSVFLALGDPAKGIVETATKECCDLIAMGSHGHKLVGDLIYGSAVHRVRHETTIPILLVRSCSKVAKSV